jgi:hypothetical protein
MALASASVGSWLSGDLEQAAAYSQQAAEAENPTFPSAGRGAAEAASDILRFRGDFEGAGRALAKVIAIARAENNLPHLVNGLADAAMVAGYAGDLSNMRTLIGQARRLLEPVSPASCRAWVDYAEGEALAEHDSDQALTLLLRSIELAEQGRAPFIAGAARLTVAGLQMRSGDPLDGRAGVIDLLHHWRLRGARYQQWITLRSVIDVLLRAGQPRDAAAVLGAVLAHDTTAETGGADRDRLASARAQIDAEVADSDEILAEWARRTQDEVVDFALERLIAGDPVS